MAKKEIHERILADLYLAANWTPRKELREKYRDIKNISWFDTAVDELVQKRLIHRGTGQGGTLCISGKGVDYYLDEFDDADDYCHANE